MPRNPDTYLNYLLDLATLLKEDFREAQQDKAQVTGNSDFESGRLLAYREVLSLMQEQALAFDIPLEEIGLAGVNPESDSI